MIFNLIKKKNNILKVGIASILIIFAAGVSMWCTKTITKYIKEPEIKEGYWNHYLRLDYSPTNVITNGYADENTLYCASNVGILFFDEIGTIATNKPLQGSSHGFDRKILFFSDFVVYKSRVNQKWITISNYYRYQSNIAQMTPSHFGTQFEEYYFYHTFGMDTFYDYGAMNNQNRFLTIITDNENTSLGVNTYIIYADIDTNQQMGVEIINRGYIEIPSLLDAYITIYHIYAWDEKFYIAFYRESPWTGGIEDGFYYLAITSDGSYREFFEPFENNYRILSFFEYQGKLFAQTGHHFVLFYTEDGENWVNTNYWVRPENRTFKEIDGFIFGYMRDDVAIITDLLGTRKLYELTKDNRAGASVTSINKFKDDLVITTTNGIFYKPFDEVINDLLNNTSEYDSHESVFEIQKNIKE